MNAIYEQLGQQGLRKSAEKAILKPDVSLSEMIHEMGYTKVEKFLKESAHLSVATYRNAVNGKPIAIESAKKISLALNTDMKKLFTEEVDTRPLSPKTIREHHALIHMILRQAEQELLVPYNAADKAKPPKKVRTTANYFEQDEINAILETAENEPLKWKTILHLMIVTGGRRGEVLGLTWDCVDFTFSRIHIEKCVYYEPSVGIYVDKPKTEKSVRWLKLPQATMELLKQYHDEYYQPLMEVADEQWQGENFLFVMDNGDKIGHVMHPDSVTQFCDRFAEKNGLKHINPHAFRHTMASLLYFSGVDTISISNHLGHATPSTTQNLYAHVLAEAESRIANAMGEIILTTRKSLKEEREIAEEPPISKTAG